jgi:hypothetical protein
MARLPLSRLLALVLAAVALLASGLVASPASAAPPVPKIWGVITDDRGTPVLDVQVQAIDEDGKVAASDLSYDDPDGDQSPRPGYFELFVGSNGSYTVTLKKSGYRSVRYVDVEVARGSRVVDLGEIELYRIFATKTVGKLADDSVSPKDKAKVTVTVTCPQGCEGVDLTGKVVVKNGRKALASATLAAAHKGKVAVTLPKLDKGTYDLKAVYSGASSLKASTSKAFTLTVKKPNRKRPNARDWLA